MSIIRKRLLWPMLLVPLAAFSVYGLITSRPKPKDFPARKIDALVAQPQPKFKQRIRVWIHGDDIRPKVIHAHPGPAFVIVENETASDVSLQIDRVLPQRAQRFETVNIGRSKKRLGQDITLAVGEYVVYEANHPGLRARILVEPRNSSPE